MPQDKYKRIVVLGDPHLPGRNLDAKLNLIREINSWNDVDLVVSIGDICSGFGTESEYKFASNFLRQIEKPFFTLIGNHDNYYSDLGFIPASKAERKEKFKRFKKAFPEQELYFSQEFGSYKLIFLALDGLDSPLYSALSKCQLDWFNDELGKEPDRKTVVFCHAPLWSEDVLKLYPPAINYIAQPASELKKVVLSHPQIKAWVAGHVHFGMKKELVEHRFNLYEGKIFNFIVCDLDGFSVLDMSIRPQFHDDLWTRSLYFYKDKLVCRTYDHRLKMELKNLEKTINF